MPQKGLKKVMGLGEAEKTFLKSFFRFPKYQCLSGNLKKACSVRGRKQALCGQKNYFFP